MTYKLLIATGNPGKLREIRKIVTTFPQLDLQIHSLQEFNIPEPEEPHSTYMENAQHKAKYYACKTGMPTLSEDSGLSITALDGFPGVRTKEFVEECGSLDNAYAKLQQMLNDTDNYAASFICAATIYFPQEDHYICFQDNCNGQLTFPARGTECFGFDPIYILNGQSKTNAELGEEIKNKFGHRGKAMRGLLQALQEYMQTKVKT